MSMVRGILVAAALCAVTASAQTPPSVSVLVPIVGSVTGANDVHWRTGIELRNDSREEMFVALRLPTAPDQPAIAFTLPPGATQSFRDVIAEAFGIDAALSPLIVQTMGKRSVRVAANVYGVHGTDWPDGRIHGTPQRRRNSLSLLNGQNDTTKNDRHQHRSCLRKTKFSSHRKPPRWKP